MGPIGKSGRSFQGPLTVMATQSRGSILMMQVCLVPACLDMFPGNYKNIGLKNVNIKFKMFKEEDDCSQNF